MTHDSDDLKRSTEGCIVGWSCFAWRCRHLRERKTGRVSKSWRCIGFCQRGVLRVCSWVIHNSGFWLILILIFTAVLFFPLSNYQIIIIISINYQWSWIILNNYYSESWFEIHQQWKVMAALILKHHSATPDSEILQNLRSLPEVVTIGSACSGTGSHHVCNGYGWYDMIC